MYVLASKLRSLPVLSLQTGETIAVTRGPIIDPATLAIVAYHCEASRGRALLLMVQDIRQVAVDCLLINSEEELSEQADIIRIQTLLKDEFTLLGAKVVTESGRKLGAVEDYTVDIDTHQIQKLYVRQSILQSLLGSSLIIDRKQVVDVSSRQITVQDTLTKVSDLAVGTIAE